MRRSARANGGVRHGMLVPMQSFLSRSMIVAAPAAGYAARLSMENGVLPPLDEMAVIALITAGSLWVWNRIRRNRAVRSNR